MSTGNAWEVVLDLLERAGVDVVFGLPADDISLLAAVEQSSIRLVVCRDQRNAAFAATGYALQSGRPGICLVGKGPALTNTVTGLLEANYAGAALAVIAAGTAARSCGTGALQEADQLAIVRPLVGWARRVEDAARLAPDLDEALLVCGAGAAGPVYLEVPDHLLELQSPFLTATRDPALMRVTNDLDAAVTRLQAAHRPILLVGGGMRHRNPHGALERLARALDAPVFVTASGRGAFDEAAPSFCGVAGLYSPPEMRQLWAETDLVVALGTRLEETAVEGTGFAPHTTDVLQVNLRKDHVDATRGGLVCLTDAEQVVEHCLSALEGQASTAAPGWAAERAQAQAALADRWRTAQSAEPEGALASVPHLLAMLDEMLPADRILVQENGLADMWPYFYPAWTVEDAAGSIVPSEQTTLGFGTAAAAGVALAAPGRLVVALVGDGAFEMVRNDIATFADEQIPILFVVLHNGGYGWLQAQLEEQRQGAAPRPQVFLRRSALGDQAATARGIRHDVASNREVLATTLAAAVDASLAGQTCVVEVPVAAHDGPLHPSRPAVEDLTTERADA